MMKGQNWCLQKTLAEMRANSHCLWNLVTPCSNRIMVVSSASILTTCQVNLLTMDSNYQTRILAKSKNILQLKNKQSDKDWGSKLIRLIEEFTIMPTWSHWNVAKQPTFRENVNKLPFRKNTGRKLKQPSIFNSSLLSGIYIDVHIVCILDSVYKIYIHMCVYVYIHYMCDCVYIYIYVYVYTHSFIFSSLHIIRVWLASSRTKTVPQGLSARKWFNATMQALRALRDFDLSHCLVGGTVWCFGLF